MFGAMSRICTTSFALVSVLALITACSDDAPDNGGDIDAAADIDAPMMPDAMDMEIDALPPPDAMEPDAAPPFNGHVLITEVTLAAGSDEFIEIYNPGQLSVPLGTYYLSDDHEYWLLPGAFSQLDPAIQPRPRINDQYDFIVKFPDNAAIGPGEVQVVAIDNDRFVGEYGFTPDYSIVNAPDADHAMLDPSGTSGVPMVGFDPGLTNGGESVILFSWDGTSDLVVDIDMVNAGRGIDASNSIQSKAGEFVDGPDADTETTGFLIESAVAIELDGVAAAGFSHKRIALEEGFEMQDGNSNGITGDNELSEDFSQTWDLAVDYDTPSPGSVPASLLP